MLKIRNLIFALGLSPLTLAVWQLPSQAGGNAPGSGSGNNMQGSTITPFSVPPAALPTGGGAAAGGGTPATEAAAAGAPGAATTTTTTTIGGETVTTTAVTTQATTTAGTPVTIPIIPGVKITITAGISTDGKLSLATTTGGDTTATVAPTAATVESTSSSLTVTDGETGKTVVLILAAQNQVEINQLGAAIIQNFNSITGGTTGGITGGTTGGTTVSVDAADIATLLTGGAGAQQAAANVTNSFTAGGITLERATALVTALTGLFASSKGSLPNQPLALATSGQLVASTKPFKPVTIIAQGSAGISVNINKLNDAIVAYNSIILQSQPQAVKNLSRNGGFVGIGGILKQLKTVIK
ncbi:hypothetical protein H6F39_14055 [Anabaena sp. FACHB-1250]|uniref:hypothetical protein n=1 Tax=Anabaena sp. FACHB-1250 TaxID=2692770 RepID=UPI001681AF7D|nr:hypothetical protein [Anabaena sp. FACHB-1250]MBD2142452.1 hypothetical protein [Anabaena sp. FACHB-1250]